MGRKLGDPADPLLVSVRSGAKFSMPGMMDTVLNIGLSDESVQGLAKQAGNERFAWDAYRRLHPDVRQDRPDIEGEHFEHAIDEAKKAKGVRNDLDLDAADLQHLVDTFKGIVKSQTGRLPAGAARAAGPGHQGRVQLLELADRPSSTGARSASPPTWAPP
jgi:Phosphoenolpyruvate synthase/pyruvate phosphate dikinase